MEYMDVFSNYLNKEISLSTAEIKIEKMLPVLKAEGRIKDYEKASLCLTYFKRYKQYDSGEINPKDLLIFIRDFVLYIGRFKFPKLITDVVDHYGDELSVVIAQDGAVDVTEKYPQSLVENKKFIRQVYSLGEEEISQSIEVYSDDYVSCFTKFVTYRSLEQKLAVHSALVLPDNHTLILSLPTGGGKSLVTQLLAAVEEKLTLVVVPTVSLASDQCLQAIGCLVDNNLKRDVFCYSSNTDNVMMFAGIRNKTARLIFTSPEAILKSERFNKELRDAAKNGYLQNVVIDEAHIVPDWGVHFRPEFQIFSVVLKEMRELSCKRIRTFLLSATLSDDVVDVLFNLFGSDGNNVQFRCDALRKEPRFIVVDNHNYDRREDEVIEMVKYLPKPLIVYVIEPDTANRYCKKMNKLGFKNVHAYTGETSDKNRDKLLEQWKNNEYDIIFATSAFGMGVDKGNVRTIIHSCVPENLSRFYQEVGRAGRDGLPSLSVMSYYVGKDDGRNDLSVAFGLVNKSILKTENLIIRLESILKNASINGDLVTANLNVVPHSFTDDEAEHAGQRNMCWNANTLLLLHRQGYIDIIEAEYDSEQRTYFFTFKIKNDELIRDSEKLANILAEDRKSEYDMRVEGYKKMADIIHRPKAKCWGKHFVSLYPYAKPICNGCPIHPEGTSVMEDAIKLRKKSIVKINPGEPSIYLKRYMGVFNDLLIPLNDYSEISIDQIIEKANKLKLSCIVLPEKYKNINSKGCLSLTDKEFVAVAKDIEWIFKNGIFVLLDDNSVTSNEIFEVMSKGEFPGYKKVWCCKPNTKITSKNRTINEFLNCRSCNLESI